MTYNKEAELIKDKIQDIRIVYCIVAGLTFREISIKFYSHNLNKVIYRIRQLYKIFNLVNRRHLAYFAVKNNIINFEQLEKYKHV